MAFTAFYVQQGVGIFDTNGGGPRLGSGGVPVEAEGNCSSNVAGDEITNDAATGWGTTVADDYICFDADGTPEYTMVTGVAGDVLTVSPAVTGSEAGKRVVVGGAWRTVDHALSTVTTAFVNAAGDPPRINLKYSATAYNEYATCDNSGTASIPLRLEGYHTTPGDDCMSGGVRYLPNIDGTGQDGAACIRANGKHRWILKNVKLTTNVDGDYGLHLYDTSFWHVENVWAKSTGTNGRSFYLNSTYSKAINCYSEESAAEGVLAGAFVEFFDCEFANAGTYGFKTIDAGYQAVLVRCVIHGAQDDGVHVLGEFCEVEGCVLYNNGLGGTGSGIRLNDPTDEPQAFIRNNIFVSNADYGIEADVAWQGLEDWNGFYLNGTDEVLNVPNRGANDVSLAADPFVAAASGDFRLTGAAKAVLAGFPGTFLSGNSVGSILMGAVQPKGWAGVATRGKHGGKQ